ncbi:MAG TPA: VTT domain-containing protein [Gemmatimonadaceae bacterium]|nr:VTT domain-containing protein [Gemmatimonadaceae bacterium]
MPGPTDAVFLPLAVADPGAALRLALWAVAGTSAGGLLAYGIGAQAFDEVGRPLLHLVGVSDRMLDTSRAAFERRGWLLVLLSTISPLPSKAVCIGAGAFGVPVALFVPALVAGRMLRFGTLAVVVRLAGPRLLDWLSRRAGVPPATTRIPARPLPE